MQRLRLVPLRSHNRDWSLSDIERMQLWQIMVVTYQVESNWASHIAASYVSDARPVRMLCKLNLICRMGLIIYLLLSYVEVLRDKAFHRKYSLKKISGEFELVRRK